MKISQRQPFPSFFRLPQWLSLEAGLFITLLLLEFAQIIYLTLTHRLGVHDTFLRTSLQYYFLNSAVTSGEVPQWIPYLTHGNPAYWWYGMQGVNSFLTYVFFAMAPLLELFNFLTLFNLAVLADRLILLTGVWLLGRRYFASPLTNFFVAASIMASNVWMTQVYFNLSFFYALPLVIHFGHTFLDTGKWRYFFLGFNLLLLQMVGNIVYFFAVESFVVFLYFACYGVFNLGEIKAAWRRLKWGGAFLFSLLGILVTAGIVYGILRFGLDPQAVLNTSGRLQGGQVGLRDFLDFCRDKTPLKWLGLSWDVALFNDYIIYMGALGLPMIIFAVLGSRSRKSLPLMFLAVGIYLLSSGSWLAQILYYVWPMMNYYRHLAMIDTITKLWLCFIAGFGFEVLFLDKTKVITPRQYFIVIVAVLMLFSFIWFTSMDPAQCMILLSDIKGVALSSTPLREAVIPEMFRLGLMKLSVTLMLVVFLWLKNNLRYLALLPACVLMFHVADLYGFCFSEMDKRTMVLTDQQYTSFGFQPFPYNVHRDNVTWSGNPREAVVRSKLKEVGASYWTMDAFLFHDQVGTSTRTDQWQKPLDDLQKVFLPEVSKLDAVRNENNVRTKLLDFDLSRPAVGKIIGLTENKIQFFRRAFALNAADVSRHLADPQYPGDHLLVSSKPSLGNTSWLVSPAPEDWWSNDRLTITHQVVHFDSNRVDVMVDNTQESAVWLYYADVWHPRWQAKVDGRPVVVFKANVAYKAVPVVPGRHQVTFLFFSPMFDWLIRLVTINTAAWLIWLGLMIARLVAPAPPAPPASGKTDYAET